MAAENGERRSEIWNRKISNLRSKNRFARPGPGIPNREKKERLKAALRAASDPRPPKRHQNRFPGQRMASKIDRSLVIMIDAADLRRLLLKFPELKAGEGAVAQALRKVDAPPEALAAWRALVAEEILPEDEDAGF